MAGCCCSPQKPSKPYSKKFRNILWIALFLNLTMFLVEVIGGLHIGSTSLWADALDFAGDAANYAISLVALGLSVYWRATAALFKGYTLLLFAILIIGRVIWSYTFGAVPEAFEMGVIGILALVVNVICAILLYAYRDGDANMQSVWLCSRNDAIGNIAVILAALGVFGTQHILPDLIVALIMASLGINSGIQIIQQASKERRGAQTMPHCPNGE
ncbi:MAG: cation transporter [Acinetobacter sp.]